MRNTTCSYIMIIFKQISLLILIDMSFLNTWYSWKRHFLHIPASLARFCTNLDESNHDTYDDGLQTVSTSPSEYSTVHFPFELTFKQTYKVQFFISISFWIQTLDLWVLRLTSEKLMVLFNYMRTKVKFLLNLKSLD